MKHNIFKITFISIVVMMLPILFIGTGLANHTVTACSVSGDYFIEVNFVNETGVPIDIFWIDYGCDEVQYWNDVPDGATVWQQTFPTHPWIIYNADTGQVIGCFVATDDATMTFRNRAGFINNCDLSHGRNVPHPPQ